MKGETVWCACAHSHIHTHTHAQSILCASVFMMWCVNKEKKTDEYFAYTLLIVRYPEYSIVPIVHIFERAPLSPHTHTHTPRICQKQSRWTRQHRFGSHFYNIMWWHFHGFVRFQHLLDTGNRFVWQITIYCDVMRSVHTFTVLHAFVCCYLYKMISFECTLFHSYVLSESQHSIVTTFKKGARI